MNIADV
jgi:hypothetical protein